MSDTTKSPVIVGLEEALTDMHMNAMMCYGGAVLHISSKEDRVQAFVTVIRTAVAMMASAIVTRTPHEEALRITIEQFPKMLNETVTEAKARLATIEALIEREGAPLQ